MSDYATLKANIRTAIKDFYIGYLVSNPIAGVTVIPVYWQDMNDPRPALPAVGIKILTSPTIGHTNVGKPDNTGNATSIVTKEFVLSTQFYSTTVDVIDAVNMLEKLVTYLKGPDSDLPLQTLTIAYVDNSEPSDISSLFGQNNIENRANTDIIFRGSYIDTNALGVIEDVNFSGTYNDPA